MQKSFMDEVVSEIENVKKNLEEGNQLSKEDMEFLLLTSLLEEES